MAGRLGKCYGRESEWGRGKVPDPLLNVNPHPIPSSNPILPLSPKPPSLSLLPITTSHPYPLLHLPLNHPLPPILIYSPPLLRTKPPPFPILSPHLNPHPLHWNPTPTALQIFSSKRVPPPHFTHVSTTLPLTPTPFYNYPHVPYTPSHSLPTAYWEGLVKGRDLPYIFAKASVLCKVCT